MLVGRHPECDIQIESRKISRRHCCIAEVGDYLVVRDLDSTNGVRINGVRVQEGTLHAGDELTIGNRRYRVSWEEDALAEQVANKGAFKDQGQPRMEEAQQPAEQAANRGAFNEPGDDEELEACEEPIPLAEPQPVVPLVEVPRSAPRPGIPVPPRAAVPATHDAGLPVPKPPDEQRILPSDIQLAPKSDVDSRHPAGRSRSRS
jgi:predicted component of type VI protein secretion system